METRTVMKEKPEFELIVYAKQGDRDAMAELASRHYASSLRLARGILRSHEDSQDAVQGAYFSAFQHIHRFRGDASFKTWITNIVVNSCRMHMRESRRRTGWVRLEDMLGHSDVHFASPAASPEKSAWRKEISSALSRAIGRLPKHLRDAYSLYAYSDLTLEEVATALGLTLAATKTRVFRAKAALRTGLGPVHRSARASRGRDTRATESISEAEDLVANCEAA